MHLLKTAALENDLSIYTDFANEWWDASSYHFRSLHAVNQHRIATLTDFFGESLMKKSIADLGCGGGLTSVPLAKLAKSVTGIDISHEAIRVATEMGGANTKFLVGDCRDTRLEADTFDVVILADVIEHIEEWELAVKESIRLTKPGGHIFVSTLNRTLQAWFLAIQVCERLSLVPRGTHSYRLFIRPSELRKCAAKFGAHEVKVVGSRPRLSKTIRSWTVWLQTHTDVSVCYGMFLRKGAV